MSKCPEEVRASSCRNDGLISPQLPSHSYLYHLNPSGIGTPQVPSLTSYTECLAAAHTVTVKTLVREVIFPRFDRTYLRQHKHASRQNTFWSDNTRALNSTGEWAADWAKVLEDLTRWKNLSLLTMRPWRNILSVRGLMRSHRAWCPACYEDWRDNPNGLYTPLLWHLEVVNLCAIHNRELCFRCSNPDCGRTQPILLPNVRPGHCSYCGHWLGTSGQASDKPQLLDLPHQEQHEWIINEVGRLLAMAPSLNAPLPSSSIGNFVSYALEDVTDGSIRGLSRVLGLSWRTTRDLAEGNQIPQLRTLLKICYRLGVSLVDALTVERPTLHLDREVLQDSPLAQRRRRRAPHILDENSVRQALDAELARDEPPPRSMCEVAESLGHDPSFLNQHFGHRCKLISDRYLRYVSTAKDERIEKIHEEIRQATHAVHTQGEYPSEKRITPLLTKPWYLSEPGARDLWHKLLRELGYQA